MSDNEIAGLVLKMERGSGVDREADGHLAIVFGLPGSSDLVTYTGSADAALSLLNDTAPGWELRSLSQKHAAWSAELVSPCGRRAVYAQRTTSLSRALIVVALKVQLQPR